MTDREKVIKAIECCVVNHTKCFDDKDKLCPYFTTKVYMCETELLKDALVLLKEHGWNVLTEDADGVIHGLPGDDGQYLMTDGKDIWIDDYVDGVEDGIILDSGRDIREITAWMCMPGLPKKDRR